jgi:hypothetical protein
LKKFITILFQKYGFILSDKWIQDALKKNVVDSTTQCLFKDILKCVGRKSIDGKKAKRN